MTKQEDLKPLWSDDKKHSGILMCLLLIVLVVIGLRYIVLYCYTIAQVEGQPLAFQHCPLVAKETVSVDEGEFRPESEGFWEWRADGMLTITRWSSTCGVSEGLKVVKNIQEHT